jgi:ribokinase
MHQVITIGSALVDVFIHTHQFQVKETDSGVMLCQTYGSKLEVDSFNVFTGGGGGNTAVGFSRLGFQTGVICETGRDSFSELVLSDLKKNGVATNLIIEEKKEQTGGSVILVCSNGERSVLVHRGAAGMLDPFDIPAYWLSQARWVHLASIGGKQNTLEKIFQYVGKNNQANLSWNPGKKELSLLANRQLSAQTIPCEIFFVNTEEWSMIADVQGEVLQSFRYVVVTAGKKGGDVYYNNEHALHFPALGGQPVDATGAGDSFATGFVSGILWEKSVKEAAEIGTKNAASVIKYYGAKTGLLTKEDLK